MHDVTTGIALVCLSGYTDIRPDTTQVILPRNDEAIDKYVVTGDPLDKLAPTVSRVAPPPIDHNGVNYETVIGLPTKLFS